MKFTRIINELQAEITAGGKIQKRKIYINNNIPKDIPPAWKQVLTKILAKLRKLGLIDSFSRDTQPIDIEGATPRGKINLVSDEGKRFTYSVEKDVLYDESNMKLG